MQVVAPKLIFDENGHGRIRQVQELLHTSRGIKGQVTNHVRPRIVLPHLIAGGREEGQQDLIFRMSGADLLDHGPSLLKLA